VRVLGIETTCDETGVAIVEDGWRTLSNCVLSQVPLHERFGGVVPEIASRAHVEAITRLIARAFDEAGLEFPERGGPPPVDAVAVAHRPGLVGSLLVGLTAAKSLALAWGVPLAGADHIHAHIYAAFLSTRDPRELPSMTEAFPAVALVVSGGHTSLYRSESWTRHRLLGSTTDDAAGEAFDKAAAILGLGYPGGPAVSRCAQGGDANAVDLPRTLLEPDSLDFSFSGLKTAVLYHAKGQNASRAGPLRPDVRLADVAASFEAAVVDVLVVKLRRALRREGLRRAVLGGGVVANRRLRARLADLSRDEGVDVRFPEPALCTDNAAMIAGLGFQLLAEGKASDAWLDVSSLASS
jgi:N6-L-threonylcarbamoyladenine synthase